MTVKIATVKQLPRSALSIATLLAFLVGVAVANFFEASLAAVGGGIFLGIALAFFARKKWQPVLLVGLLILGTSAGMLRFSANVHEATPATLDFYNDREITTELRGIISREPDRRTDHMKYTLAISARDGKPIIGNLLVKAPRLPEYFYGDELILRGKLQTPFETDEFSYRDYLARYDIFSVIYYAQIEKISADNKSFLFAKLFGFKRAFEAKINQVFPEPHASFEAGLLIGSRRGIPPDVLEDFNTTGLTHIIAVSGYNVALVIALVTGLFGSLVARRWQFPLAVVFVTIFTLLVGANAPVLRAAVMGLLAFYALTSGRQTYAPLALVFTAAAMVAFNPRILLSDVAFQLSFAAVAGLLFVAPVFEKLVEKVPNKFAIRESLLMTLSAQVTAVPLIVFYFDRFSLISPLANILVAPAIPLAMLVGFIAVVVGTIFLPAGLLVGFLAYGLLSYILWIAKTFAALPVASVTVGWFGISFVVVYYIALIWFLIWRNSKKPS